MASVVIYHDNCVDGFCAAWICNKNLQDCTFIPFQYYQPVTDEIIDQIKDKYVYIVDFSFDREIILKLASGAKSLVVLDHHKTAKATLEGLAISNGKIIFNMELSGAMLTWQYFSLAIPPKLVDYVQDYDLWRFNLPASRAINAWIQNENKTFANYDYMATHLSIDSGFTEALRLGNFILQLEDKQIEQNIKNAIRMNIGGYDVPVINNPVLISKTLERLCKNESFAAAFFFSTDLKFKFSLRSRDGSDMDVSKIAKFFPGGGGHKHAAGFSIDNISQFLSNPR